MQVKYRNFVLQIIFFSLKFVGTVFIYSLFDLASASINIWHVITKLSIVLAKYVPSLQLLVARFQI